MKYIKAYEKLSDEPQIGDYVLCEINDYDNRLEKFTKSNIGQIISKDNSPYPYRIKYENIPTYLKGRFGYDNTRGISREEIINFSPNKEDLKALLNAIKYNL